MSNQRKHQRLPLPMKVEVCVEGQCAVATKTRDMSDGGVFLEHNENLLLQAGTKLTIKVIESMSGGEANQIPATVVRVTEDGVAVKFDIG